ncbi:MAG: DUF1295 domain-containing protein [Planctomycetota bacterium]
MTDTLLPLALGGVAVSAAMCALWLVQRRTNNAGIVDVAWSAAIGCLALFYAAWPAGPPRMRMLVAFMFGLWSIRLTIHLYRRVVGKPEEGRYASLRRDWGDAHDAKMFVFYQFQAFAAWVFAAPALAICRSQPPAAWLAATSLGLWILGILGVALSDRQLAQFKTLADSSGKTCRRGLWRYSRHPNYFFEWVHWLSYVPLAAGDAYWWMPALVAAALLYLVLFVTGIPPTERQAVASRGDDYREYQRTTSAFVPWFTTS